MFESFAINERVFVPEVSGEATVIKKVYLVHTDGHEYKVRFDDETLDQKFGETIYSDNDLRKI